MDLRKTPHRLSLCFLLFAVESSESLVAAQPFDREICAAIARDIESVKRDFPGLRDFAADQVIDRDAPRLTYEYKCKPSTVAAGWRSGVPEPERDGVWLYLELWDPGDATAAQSQLNTQPVTPDWRIGSRKVTFHLLTGVDNAALEPVILGILQKHGMTTSNSDAEIEPLFLASPEEAVTVATALLRQRDFATLVRYYDLAGSGLERESLNTETFFMRSERPEAAHPGEFWRYRQPFAPGFTYASHEATDQPSVHRVHLRIEIDEGGGRTQVGLAEFLMRQSPAGWQFLPVRN